MKEFTQSMPFLLFFLFGTLLINMFMGKKMAENFLILVFLSMLVLNSEEVKKLLGRVNFKHE